MTRTVADMSAPVVAAASFAYLFLLFAIAWAGDRPAGARAA